MLYLDSSALVKRYVKEFGTDALNARLAEEERAGQALFSSALTFAEVNFALWRESKSRKISNKDFRYAKDSFLDEWTNRLTTIELSVGVLGLLEQIYEHTGLRSSGAVQLASCIWIRDLFRLSERYGPKGSRVAFAASDVKLAQAGANFGLEVFNPERPQLP